MSDDDFEIRPGRIRDRSSGQGKARTSFRLEGCTDRALTADGLAELRHPVCDQGLTAAGLLRADARGGTQLPTP